MHNPPPILVIGSSNVDLIMKVERLPGPGETVGDGDFSQTFGGKGANAAVGAARAGGKVTFVTCLGNDPYAEAFQANLQADGIDTTHLLRMEDTPTGHAVILVDKSARNSIAVSPGANYRLTPERIEALRPLIRNAGRLLLQCEIPAGTVAHALRVAGEESVPVLFNLAPARPTPSELLARVDVLVVNESEAAFLLGREVIEGKELEAVRSLLALGVSRVVLTMGAAGLIAGEGADIRQVEAFEVEAVDTTAAGDIFCGALAVGLGEGRSFWEALRFASAASALSVTRFGAQPSAPHRQEIEEFLRERAE